MSDTSSVDEAFREYVEGSLVVALIDGGRRPTAAKTAAAILAPVVVAMLDDPLVRAYLAGRLARGQE